MHKLGLGYFELRVRAARTPSGRDLQARS
jgi:hypothetical protein